MNVIGRGTKLLFCEGEPQSLDYRLLNALLRGSPPTTLIVPAGGKQGLKSFVRGRRAGYPDPPDYLVFRDRDFDVEPPRSVELISLWAGRPVFLSHRAAVENYLLDVTLIDRYWNAQAAGATSWRHGLSPGIDDIRSWIDEAAQDLRSYQATRWSLASLKPSERWPELGTTWTEGSGHLPVSLAEDDCVAQAKRLVGDFADQAGSVSEERLLENYQRFSTKFASSDFLDQAEYLVWFHGKDLKKAMQRMRRHSISLEHFMGWAVEHIDWTQHADLQQLAARI